MLVTLLRLILLEATQLLVLVLLALLPRGGDGGLPAVRVVALRALGGAGAGQQLHAAQAVVRALPVRVGLRLDLLRSADVRDKNREEEQLGTVIT